MAGVESARRHGRFRRDPADLTARARIRDAALFLFARDGFRAPMRTIADIAGVSVALITHHYGTKDALRVACDDEVMSRFLEMELLALRQPDSVEGQLRDSAAASVLTVYMVQSFLDASGSAGRFFSRYVDHLRTILTEARQAGMISESDDPESQLHVLATQSIGMLIVEFAIDPPADPRHFIDHVHTTRQILAQLELYSHPFFPPSPAMDTYIDILRRRAETDGADSDRPSDN
jgi:AcrR family transcriptional regulator